jgi:hypothetical protein
MEENMEHLERGTDGRGRTSAVPVCAILLLGGVALACASNPARLTPAAGARISAISPNAAISERNGVRIYVEAQAWPGPASITREVTPLKVTIENNGPTPVAIRYDRLYLSRQDGERFAALPPFKAKTEAAEAITPPLRPTPSVWFTHRGFLVAPYLRYYYPGLRPFGYAYTYDPIYYERYLDYWAQRRIAMDEIRRHALPEGVVEPGGQVTGFVYFEDVDEDAARVSFHAELPNPGSGLSATSLTVPFDVS